MSPILIIILIILFVIIAGLLYINITHKFCPVSLESELLANLSKLQFDSAETGNELSRFIVQNANDIGAKETEETGISRLVAYKIPYFKTEIVEPEHLAVAKMARDNNWVITKPMIEVWEREELAKYGKSA